MRSLTQDDSHVFCRPDQIQQEINNLLVCAQELYDIVGMKLRVRLVTATMAKAIWAS